MKKLILKTILVCLLCTLLFNFLLSQNFMFQDMPKDTTHISVKYQHPNFAYDVELSTLSGIYDFSFTTCMRPHTYLNISVPFITVKSGESESENGLGNIYLGIQFNSADTSINDKNITSSIGIFLPTMPDDKLSLIFFGMFTDIHQIQKYAPDYFTVYGNISHRKKNPYGFIHGLEFGPNLYIPTENDGAEVEFYLHYGITGGVQLTNFAIAAELLGLVVLTEDVDEFSDRFAHSLVFGLQWTQSIIKPGIFYKIYLEKNQSDYIDGVLGIKVDALLK